MLILTRKSGERITIGNDIVITLLEIKGSQVKLGVEAPKSVIIHRQEVYEAIKKEQGRANGPQHGDAQRPIHPETSQSATGPKS